MGHNKPTTPNPSTSQLPNSNTPSNMSLKLADVITRNPHCLKESDSVLQAAKIMKDQGVGVVPIVDENRKPCGILTDRDIVIRCIGEAMDLMKKKQLHRLVCVDRNDKLCGM